jgi:hypothetical protein
VEQTIAAGTAMKKIRNHARMLRLAIAQRPGSVEPSTLAFLLEGLYCIEDMALEADTCSARSA